MSDPNQRFIMNFMPIMLTVMLYRAPSGLMIYWVAGNIWQMGHQYLTTRAIQAESDEPPAPAKESGGAQRRPAAKPEPPAKRKASPRERVAQKRKEAAKARRRATAEDSSLPRWMRRGGA